MTPTLHLKLRPVPQLVPPGEPHYGNHTPLVPCFTTVAALCPYTVWRIPADQALNQRHLAPIQIM